MGDGDKKKEDPKSGDAKVRTTTPKDDGGDNWVIYYTITSNSDQDMDLTLKEWPHGDSEGGNIKRSPKPEVKNPDEKKVKVKVPAGKTVTQALVFPKKLGKITAFYTWLYWYDAKGNETLIWDQIHPLPKALKASQAKGPFVPGFSGPPTGGAPLATVWVERGAVIIDDLYHAAWPTPIPTTFPAGNDFTMIVPFPAIYPRKVFDATWPEVLSFVIESVRGAPSGWDIDLLYPRLGQEFSPHPLSRSSQGVMRIRYPRDLPEGLSVTLKVVQRTIGRPATSGFSVEFPIRLVVDHTGPILHQEDIVPDYDENRIRCRVQVSDHVSGVSECVIAISMDGGRVWARVPLAYDPGSLGRGWDAYGAVLGPFPSGRILQFRVEARDGVGNRTQGASVGVSFYRVSPRSSGLVPAGVGEFPVAQMVVRDLPVSRDLSQGMPALTSMSGGHELVPPLVEGMAIGGVFNSRANAGEVGEPPSLTDKRRPTGTNTADKVGGVGGKRLSDGRSNDSGA